MVPDRSGRTAVPVTANCPRILSIAGSDSGGGAGIQADIKTITMLGGHAMTAITAITAQNTLGVQAVHQVPTKMVLDQIEAVVGDIGVDAIKIGMIGNAKTALAVADYLMQIKVPVVFDPVMVATSGSELADAETIAAFEKIMKLATVVTPNIPEAMTLGGEDVILSNGCHLLLKGGHSDEPKITDRLFVQGGGVYEWFSDRVDTVHTHGTGCSLASALAEGLARGLSLEDSVDRGISFVQAAIRSAPAIGLGHGPVGHTLGIVPFYLALEHLDQTGFSAQELAARWNDKP